MITVYVLYVEWSYCNYYYYPHAQHPVVGPPIFIYPLLLIQYIRIYLPYLEAASSIRNLRTRFVVVTKGPSNHVAKSYNRRIHVHKMLR